MKHVLWETLEVLRERGLNKHSTTGDDGSVCLYGALGIAAAGNPHRWDMDAIPEGSALRRVISEQYGARFTHQNGTAKITQFVVDPDITQADVERVIEKAAIALDEAVE